MSLDYPPRIALARTPTPLEKLERTSAALGVEVYAKRDDLTGLELSGNKVRKLEFLMAEALAQGADTVITCGGEQSNHCRATALAASKLGLRSVVLLRVKNPEHPPPLRGNVLLDRLAGAEVVWVTPAEYARRGERMAEEAERLRAGGLRPYVIPEGGSNAVGSWGYIRAVEELATDLSGLERVDTTTVLSACGSGGTTAGLLAGVQRHGLDSQGVRVAGVNVCNDRGYFQQGIHDITVELEARGAPVTRIDAAAIDILDGYVGRGYARSRPEELELIRDVARREGLLLDPVYTGKAFFGMTRELAQDRERLGQRIVFVHTGGVFGLFAAAEALGRVL